MLLKYEELGKLQVKCSRCGCMHDNSTSKQKSQLGINISGKYLTEAQKSESELKKLLGVAYRKQA